MPRRPLARLALLLPLVLAAACEGPPPGPPTPPPPPEPGPPAYAAHARELERLLGERLQKLVTVTRPLVQDLRDQLRGQVDALEAPVRFATKEPFLRRWGEGPQADFQARVQAAYQRTRQTLAKLYETAMDKGIDLAQALAPERSPLDAGATGNRLLDASVSAFQQTLDGLFDFAGMDLRQQQDVLRRVELIETFTSFGIPGADDALGGRLMLFVGGEERSAEPEARVVLRCDPGVEPATRRFFQVARHRVMRGNTTVHDTGWNAYPAPDGAPVRVVEGRHIVGAGIAPLVRTQLVGFDQLRDMRVVVDLQTAVLDDAERVLGGVDWRIVFRVTLRGDVSWQVGDVVPVFDPGCPEAAAVLAGGGA